MSEFPTSKHYYVPELSSLVCDRYIGPVRIVGPRLTNGNGHSTVSHAQAFGPYSRATTRNAMRGERILQYNSAIRNARSTPRGTATTRPTIVRCTVCASVVMYMRTGRLQLLSSSSSPRITRETNRRPVNDGVLSSSESVTTMCDISARACVFVYELLDTLL